VGSRLFFGFFGLLFLSAMLSFLRRLDGPAKSADVSMTVSGKGRFLDEGSSMFLDGKEEIVVGSLFFFGLDFTLEEKISSISDMVARKKVLP
jgi:hypothetical protein